MLNKRTPLNRLVAIGFITSLILASQVASADWYIGASVGQSKIDAESGEIEAAFLIDDAFVATGTSLDETDTGWKAYVAYRILPVFAVEATYADLGEASFLTTIESAPPPNDALTPFEILGTATADGFQLSAVLELSLVGPISLIGKVGAFRWEAEFTEEIVETGAIRVARTEAEVDALYGVGLQVSMSDSIAARVEWERLENVGEGIGGRSGRDLDFISAGLILRF